MEELKGGLGQGVAVVHLFVLLGWVGCVGVGGAWVCGVRCGWWGW